jgi:predicted flap endonuclease-1-like 5' DNA nuclease
MCRRWRIWLPVAAVTALIVWWWLRRPPARRTVDRAGEEPGAGPRPAPPPSAPEPLGDDLTRVEGIGPKVSDLLRSEGISTFTALAMTSPERLREILRREGLPFMDPGTWPEQARLAAGGAWDRLEALQDGLRGGRRDPVPGSR